MCLFVISALLWQRQDHQEVIMGYTVNLRTIWPTPHFMLKNLNRKIKHKYWPPMRILAGCLMPWPPVNEWTTDITHHTIDPWCAGGSESAFTKCLVGTSSIYSCQIKQKNKFMKLERIQLRKKHLHFVDLEDGIENRVFLSFCFYFFRPGDTELSLLFIQLQDTVRNRNHPIYRTHIRHHACLPGAQAWGNGEIDQLLIRNMLKDSEFFLFLLLC